VGFGRKRYLKAGETIEVAVEGLGTQRQTVVEA
jgi:2-keto-4-pentenoate hydratase/2-oxohepta-3-ene-1,7-dioic acid hydratase in catechol pathway